MTAAVPPQELDALIAKARDDGVSELLGAFDAWLQSRGKSANTRRLYLRNAREFLLWLGELTGTPPPDSDAVVNLYYEALEARQPGNSGNFRRTTAARAFLSHAGLPPKVVRSRSGPYHGQRRSGARYLDLEETVAVLETVRERAQPQEIALVGLLLFSEMSPRLLTSLTLADLAGLDLTALTWHIDRGESSWTFSVPHAIAHLVLELAAPRGQAEGPLFIDAAGRALTRNSLDLIMKTIGEAAGVVDLAAFRLTISRSKRSGQGVSWDALPASEGEDPDSAES